MSEPVKFSAKDGYRFAVILNGFAVHQCVDVTDCGDGQIAVTVLRLRDGNPYYDIETHDAAKRVLTGAGEIIKTQSVEEALSVMAGFPDLPSENYE